MTERGWRGGLRALCAALVLLAGGAGEAAAEKITLGVDWQIFGRHAGFVVAQDKGFYKAEGLDVDVIRGYGAADAVKRIAAGTITAGTGDTGALVISRSQGIKVKAVGMVYGTIILRGGYLEERPEGFRPRGLFALQRFRRDDAHAIRKLFRNPTWTLGLHCKWLGFTTPEIVTPSGERMSIWDYAKLSR